MLNTLDELNFTGATKRFVLMLLIFLGCLVSASGQNSSTREIIELFEINALQMDIWEGKHSGTDDAEGWILSDGNATLVAQEGNRSQAHIIQVSGAENAAKVLQQGNGNRIGSEREDRKQMGVLQSGSRNYTEMKQFGNLNSAETFQYGNCNEANVVQLSRIGGFTSSGGWSNKSVVIQEGNGNTATVLQIYP